MRVGNISVPLICPQMFELRIKPVCPVYRFALVAIMPEPKRIMDVWHMLCNKRTIAAKTVASEDQFLTRDCLRPTIWSLHTRTSDLMSIKIKMLRVALANDINLCSFTGGAQRINQFRPRSGWQAVHPSMAMPGIVKIGHNRERKVMRLFKPFNDLSRVFS